jgi:hypothetical protein
MFLSMPVRGRAVVMLWVAVSAARLAAAQTPAGTDAGAKQATAVRTAAVIDLDGHLNEEAWQRAVPVTDFIQKEPIEGAAPTERMDVRFLYDDKALYVGARMHSVEPSAIQAPLGRRDRAEQAEHILVSLDTFHDRRTAYAFGVTASGVRLDRFYPADDTAEFVEGYDPVWEAKAAIGATGWTAELWIPLSQLRFTDRPQQVWGLNIQRFTPTLNEENYWAPVPRTEKGWASHFGELHGIRDLPTVRRIEVAPYVAGTAIVSSAARDVGNPFSSGQEFSGQAGADLKVGIGPNLTLDVTVNPDFGQVEADPAEVNLSAFQTRFPEKRPFFTEGAQLLAIAHQNVFYSRRIGARPSGPAPGDYVNYPSASTIVAAGKLTGRLRSGTSIGMLSAVTDEESADVSNLAAPGVQRVRVAARTLYSVARVQQEFGRSASTVSVMAAAVHRDLKDGDPLTSLLTRNAVLAGADTLLRLKGGEYEVVLAGVGTVVAGDAPAIERVQRSSAHYMQRPDQDYSPLDSTRTSLGGYSVIAAVRRVSGRHWLWSVNTKTDTPGFESNDIANLTAADSITPTVEVRYRETRPTTIFRNYSVGLRQTGEWSFGRERTATRSVPFVNVTWKNFWTSSLSVTNEFRARDISLTRGGPAMGIPRGWSVDAALNSSTAVSTRWSGKATIGADENGGTTRRLNASISIRPGPRWELAVTPNFEQLVDTLQYVSTLGNGRIETFGSRYVFAHVDRRTFSSQYRLNFTFRPDLNLDVYAEPFASSGRYFNHGELSAPGSAALLRYGSSGTGAAIQPDGSRIVTAPEGSFTLKNTDFNVRSFRSNVVLRWEWRPGSTLYFVWQQNRQGTDATGSPVRLGDMFRSVTAPGPNYFVVKTSLWLPF